MNVTIVPVPPGEFIKNWAVVEPMLAAAMPVNLRRYLPVDILLEMLAADQARSPALAQGWFILEDEKIERDALSNGKAVILALMVSKVTQFPRRRCLSVFCLAGARMAEWFGKAEEILTDYATRFGCDHFECQGRRGWERILDLEPRATFLVKDLAIGGATKTEETTS